MESWTSGYVTDVNYVNGYYVELNPTRTALALSNQAIASKRVKNVCELGFGQGVSIAAHAASQANVEYWGTDFNPSQALFAKTLVQSSGANCHLYDQSFEEFCTRADLPQFDFIGLHGIWSWISDENRHIIVKFLRERLAVGGILYISYNTLPGWAAAVPMRHMFTLHASTMSTPGQKSVDKVAGAIDFFDSLMKLDPNYAKMNPKLADRFEKIKTQDPRYLAHEYFNRDWQPMHFSTMADWLAPAKVSFACSANLPDHVNILNLSKEQSEFLKELPDASLRETVRDMFVNQQFRRDYWMKGVETLNPLQKQMQAQAIRIIMTAVRESVDLTMQATVGMVTLSEKVYGPILDALADNQIKTIGELANAVRASHSVSFDQVMEAVVLLVAKGIISVVQAAEDVEASRISARKFNNHLLGLAQQGSAINFLVSPLVGGALAVSNVDQLFLCAYKDGRKSVEELVSSTWHTFTVTGTRLKLEGDVVKSDQQNKDGLTSMAQEFLDKKLKIFRQLGIID